MLEKVLKNQNGNRGFGQEFDKLFLVVGDLRCFNRDREVFEVYIDGGMYAMRVLDSLYYEKIASVPLSASLTKEQEENVRRLLKIDPAEVLIMFIGIGNYPDECQTTHPQKNLHRISVNRQCSHQRRYISPEYQAQTGLPPQYRPSPFRPSSSE